MSRDKFAKNYAEGENPIGFVAVTPNGNASDRGDGINHQWNFGINITGPRWSMPDQSMNPPPFGGNPATTVGNKRRKNMNRSGE